MATCLRFQPNFVRSCMNLVNNRCFSSLSLYSGSPNHNKSSNSARSHYQQGNRQNTGSSKRLLHDWISMQSCKKLNLNMFCLNHNFKVNYSQSSNANSLKESKVSSDKDRQAQELDHCSRVHKILVNEWNQCLHIKGCEGPLVHPFQICQGRGDHTEFVNRSEDQQYSNTLEIDGLAVGQDPDVLAFSSFKFSKTAAEESDSMEGVSTFYLDNKGYICRHRLDRVQYS